MKWTSLNEIRERYLKFFQDKGHTRLDSFPLVPQEDKSLLLINSGMAPLKKYFMGQAIMPNNKATTCQKCIRTPDIENVGITARHGTFFEMLGNFSFGDYFKNEATEWAWEFLTKELELPIDCLHVSVYEEDDEAYDIWTQKIGVEPSHMHRLGKADNFWEIGTGPCGPCSEIYFDRGEKYSCGKDTCTVGCDCDRYVEFWNLVFTQFDSDGNGNYALLDKPNIDTGMGLERIACIMQEVDNMFEVDTIANIIKEVENISKVKYKEDSKVDISVRVITDHVRSTVFMISDGVLPSNEGRGYVLRRLLRRAARHGRMIGINGMFLHELSKTVVNESKQAYPELLENAEYIQKVIKAEEERFNTTIDQGMNILNNMIDSLEKQKTESETKMLSGEEAFRLNDTFGFPFELTKEILLERGILIDEDGFRKHLKEQAQRARDARKKAGDIGWSDDLFQGINQNETEFVGYTNLEAESKVLAIGYENKLETAISVDEGEKQGVLIVLDKTPFYAQGGGQRADIGVLKSENATLEVMDCKKSVQGYYIHTCVLKSGILKTNDKVSAVVDTTIRKMTQRNHTSAHLLQQVLRDILGNHVHQSGSDVDENRVRFDFTHFSAMTKEEIINTEFEVNKAILQALPVEYFVTTMDKAKEMGAIALFGEKYTEDVRVLKIGDFSVELCGGTHVSNTSEIGLFKIVSESSVAAGIRRIEAVTSIGVLQLLNKNEQTLNEIANTLKTNNTSEILIKLNQTIEEAKQTKQELDKLKLETSKSKIDGLFESPEEVGDLKVVTAYFRGTSADALRQMCFAARDKAPKAVIVFCGESEGKVTVAASCGKIAVEKGVKAGEVAKQVAALTGGSGGGKADFAMAGIKDASLVDEALAKVKDIVAEIIK